MNSKRQGILSIFLSRVLYFGVGISYILAYGNNFTIINFLIGFILGFILLLLMLKRDWNNFFKSLLGRIIILSMAFLIIV